MSAHPAVRRLHTVVRRLVTGCVVVLLATSCGSDKEPAGANAALTSAASGPAAGSTAVVASGSSPDDLSQWFEDETSPATPAVLATQATADPDAVIERYKGECAGGAKSAECRALRWEVEAIFLESLVAVRTSSAQVDPRWYRLAAASENPQLACIGVTELVWDPKRTAQDDALIARALESPYHAVRGAVVLNSSRFQALNDVWSRNGGFNYSDLTGVCMDSGRDLVPPPKWAGGYPGAQFRPFASNESRRWFTTPDPPEKVVAWFASRGKSVRTEQQMLADAQARYMQEMTELSSDPEVDNTQKMMEVMMNQASDAQWSAPFRNMEGIGEIKYAMIGSGQAIAIFRDDLFKATSIVATRPQPAMNLTAVDIEAEQKRAKMRAILGY